MKNSPLAALLLVVMAGVIGGLTWMLSGDDPIESDAKTVDVPEVSPNTVEVVAMTPRERMLKGRLEAELREIERYRKQGVTMPNGQIKVTDVDGEPLYIHPKLVEGVGRYGEPLYATVKYKRRAAVPVRKEIKSLLPEKARPTLMDARDKKILTLGTKPGEEDAGPPKGASTGGEDGSGGAAAGGSGDGAGKPTSLGDG